VCAAFISGIGPSQYIGTQRLRTLVASRKEEYNSVDSYKIKKSIGSEIYDEITRRGGRFLQQVSSNDRARGNGARDNILYEEVPRKKGEEKCKQLLREKAPTEDQQRKAKATEENAHQVTEDPGDHHGDNVAGSPEPHDASSSEMSPTFMGAGHDDNIGFEGIHFRELAPSAQGVLAEEPFPPLSPSRGPTVPSTMLDHQDHTEQTIKGSLKGDKSNDETPEGSGSDDGRSETRSSTPLDALEKVPADANASFDEESYHILMERPLCLSPLLPSMLVESERPCISDAHLELFQPASEFGYQQPRTCNPEQHTIPSHERPNPSPATYSATAGATPIHDERGSTHASFPPKHPYSEEDDIPNKESTTTTSADPYQGNAPRLGLWESLLTILGLGADQPKFTDVDEQQEWAALTDDEKTSALADLFGDKCSVGTHQKKRARRDLDKITVSFLLGQMRDEIDTMPEKKKVALTVAQGKCREEEFSDSRLEVFLTSEGMNAKVIIETQCPHYSPRTHKDIAHVTFALTRSLALSLVLTSWRRSALLSTGNVD
jgi:hypothetical protein